MRPVSPRLTCQSCICLSVSEPLGQLPSGIFCCTSAQVHLHTTLQPLINAHFCTVSCLVHVLGESPFLSPPLCPGLLGSLTSLSRLYLLWLYPDILAYFGIVISWKPLIAPSPSKQRILHYTPSLRGRRSVSCPRSDAFSCSLLPEASHHCWHLRTVDLRYQLFSLHLSHWPLSGILGPEEC